MSALQAYLKTCLRVANDAPELDSEGFGHSHDGVNGDRPVGTFHLADVNGVQVGLFRQFLLGRAPLLPVLADVLANSFVRLKAGHKRLQKQA